MLLTDREIITALISGKFIKRNSDDTDCMIRLVEPDSLHSGFEGCYTRVGYSDDNCLCLEDIIADDWEVVKNERE